MKRVTIEYTVPLGAAGTVTLRYEGVPLSELPDLERGFVEALLAICDKYEVKG